MRENLLRCAEAGGGEALSAQRRVGAVGDQIVGLFVVVVGKAITVC